MKPLKLKTLVCKEKGLPRKLYFKEYQKDMTKFCTLKQFLDNPDTKGIFEFYNPYFRMNIHYEVFDYLDSKEFSPEECAENIEIRKQIAYLSSKTARKYIKNVLSPKAYTSFSNKIKKYLPN